jgi:hypothetical protein
MGEHSGFPRPRFSGLSCRPVPGQPCSFRNHCAPLRCRQNPGRDHRGLHYQEILPCAVYILVRHMFRISAGGRDLSLLCPCRVSVMQWRQQFIQWSNITDRQIAVFTADQKEKVSLRDL